MTTFCCRRTPWNRNAIHQNKIGSHFSGLGGVCDVKLFPWMFDMWRERSQVRSQAGAAHPLSDGANVFQGELHENRLFMCTNKS